MSKYSVVASLAANIFVGVGLLTTSPAQTLLTENGGWGVVYYPTIIMGNMVTSACDMTTSIGNLTFAFRTQMDETAQFNGTFLRLHKQGWKFETGTQFDINFNFEYNDGYIQSKVIKVMTLAYDSSVISDDMNIAEFLTTPDVFSTRILSKLTIDFPGDERDWTINMEESYALLDSMTACQSNMLNLMNKSNTLPFDQSAIIEKNMAKNPNE